MLATLNPVLLKELEALAPGVEVRALGCKGLASGVEGSILQVEKELKASLL